MPTTAPRHWTVDELWALPEESGVRYEVVDGELLVNPSPARWHQRAVARLLVLLTDYCERTGAGEVLPAPYDVVLDRRDTLVQPDLLVIPIDLAVPDAAGLPQATLRLAVEVLSPGTARQDRLRKRPRYQRAGIPVWLVDLDGWVIEQWEPGSAQPVVCADELVWAPDWAAEPFCLDVAALMTWVHRGADEPRAGP
jgi:Uma2 family endonuclease